MARFKYCEDCDKEINSNIKFCKTCCDIRLHGSVAKAREAAIKNFELLGIKVK